MDGYGSYRPEVGREPLDQRHAASASVEANAKQTFGGRQYHGVAERRKRVTAVEHGIAEWLRDGMLVFCAPIDLSCRDRQQPSFGGAPAVGDPQRT